MMLITLAATCAALMPHAGATMPYRLLGNGGLPIAINTAIFTLTPGYLPNV